MVKQKLTSFAAACLAGARRTGLALAAGALAVLPAGGILAGDTPQGPAAKAGAPDVFVPSFWDPAALPERPPGPLPPSLRFVTEENHPPFAFTLADGTLVGFDVDLARALCTTLGVTCTIQVRRYDTILLALRAGAADAAIASLAITDAALTQVDFTSPYYRTPARFVGKVGATVPDVDPEALAGKRIAVARGSAHEAFLAAFFPGADLRPYPNAADAMAALKSGAADLVFADGIALARWLGDGAGPCCAFVGGPYTESRFFGRGAGIAVRRGDGRLRAALDDALARLAAEGRYGDLYLKYFPIGFY